jgi:hypothetical protein
MLISSPHSWVEFEFLAAATGAIGGAPDTIWQILNMKNCHIIFNADKKGYWYTTPADCKYLFSLSKKSITRDDILERVKWIE